MPVYEFRCSDSACANARRRVEHYLNHYESPNPPCVCGAPTERLISAARAIWLKPLVEYDNKKGETYQKESRRGAHTVACKRSFGGTDDKPVFKRIETRREQAEYCRQEGCLDPSEIGNIEIHSDGMGTTSQGNPGSWV